MSLEAEALTTDPVHTIRVRANSGPTRNGMTGPRFEKRRKGPI